MIPIMQYFGYPNSKLGSGTRLPEIPDPALLRIMLAKVLTPILMRLKASLFSRLTPKPYVSCGDIPYSPCHQNRCYNCRAWPGNYNACGSWDREDLDALRL